MLLTENSYLPTDPIQYMESIFFLLLLFWMALCIFLTPNEHEGQAISDRCWTVIVIREQQMFIKGALLF